MQAPPLHSGSIHGKSIGMRAQDVPLQQQGRLHLMTIKHLTIAAAISWLVTFASASAADVAQNKVAQSNSDKPQKGSAASSTFTALDRNGDHRISRSEAGFDRVMSETFAEIDSDGDGFVSTAEFAAAETTRNAVSSNLSAQ
jgi:hypothetical protein